jgi:Barrel-sandwich domain of CusB or HlyD membrane-fusion
MTPLPMLRRIGTPLASAIATALVFTGGLWIQHARSGWPFGRPIDTPRVDTMAGMAQTTGADTHKRVPVDAAAARSLDIRLETVGRESLTQTVRAVATIVPDESRISMVHTRVAGWIEQLDINTTGEEVRAGEPLAHVFSQELLSSQTEYLAARRNIAASGITSAVVASGRTRLGVLGMTAAEIDAIDQSGEPKRLVTVVAPRSGVVVNRGVTVGTSVDPSTTLLTIADLSRVGTGRGAGSEYSSRPSRHQRPTGFSSLWPATLQRARRLRLSHADRTHADTARAADGSQPGWCAAPRPLRHRVNRVERTQRHHRPARRSRRYRYPAARVRGNGRSVRASASHRGGSAGRSRRNPGRLEGRRADRCGRGIPARLREPSPCNRRNRRAQPRCALRQPANAGSTHRGSACRPQAVRIRAKRLAHRT